MPALFGFRHGVSVERNLIPDGPAFEVRLLPAHGVVAINADVSLREPAHLRVP